MNERALFILKRKGDIEEAIKYLNLARGLNEKDHSTNYNLGQLYLHLENLEKAEECALQAIELRKDFLIAHDLLGNVFFKQGRYENALKEFKHVIEISRSDAQGHYNLAVF